MTAPVGTSRPNAPLSRQLNWRLISLLIAGGVVALLIAANTHLVYVALVSQPDCVPHVKSSGEDGTFRAARSAC
ncbi:hypothetical protein [Hyphomicrobium sp.]|uniref:hypothetical protein n=1 Tax=Hyphomicrobium sp. TaxID=82 RepID=UPI002E2F8DDB|nr:hypothetical protein [Hyphomicrobium sp.]HEX2842703.1 hypothetical protein [Hyphomicrobium sp.]